MDHSKLIMLCNCLTQQRQTPPKKLPAKLVQMWTLQNCVPTHTQLATSNIAGEAGIMCCIMEEPPHGE